ncbi:hypothetical protein FJZ31_22770 [Candidatus Poribacteria bacterium]|nr:hypothetical protein [Candidatus Poribacteria bacterium]
MGRYDIGSKVLFKDYERDFVALTLKDRDFEIVGTIPTEFPSVQMRMTDAPVKVRIGDEEAIVYTEFQTETSADPMEYRIAEYVGKIIHEYRLPVYVTVIYLGPSAGINDPGGYEYTLGNTFSYSLRYQVLRFAEMNGQKILDKKEPIGLIPFAALMKRPDDVNFEEWLRQCAQVVLSIPMESDEKKRDYIASFYILSSLVRGMELVTQLLKEERIMIEIEKSPVIKMFTEKTRIEALAEGYTNALMKVIKRQYGEVGLQEFEQQIRTIRDEKKLTTLMEFALNSTSFEQFKKILANTI